MILNNRYEVDIEQNVKNNIGYLEMNDAALNLRIASQLILYGNKSANGIIWLENAIIDNKGIIRTRYADVNGKPSLRMNFRSDLINKASPSLESND